MRSRRRPSLPSQHHGSRRFILPETTFDWGCVPFSSSGLANRPVNGVLSAGDSRKFDWEQLKQCCFIGSIPRQNSCCYPAIPTIATDRFPIRGGRSEEHTSELQSLRH